MRFTLVPADPAERPTEDWRPKRLPPLQGLCGHFVKYTGYQNYYNGSFNCARTLYVCTLCGLGEIEHV